MTRRVGPLTLIAAKTRPVLLRIGAPTHRNSGSCSQSSIEYPRVLIAASSVFKRFGSTMVFGVMDPKGHLEFINAVHPSPFLIRNGRAETPFTEGSYPVGLVPEAEYTAACLKLEPGDTLVLFSDGVTEAMDPDDEMYGMARLCEVLHEKGDVPLEHLQKCVLESVENFVRGARQADDVTLLLVRYMATAKDALSDTDAPSASSAVA